MFFCSSFILVTSCIFNSVTHFKRIEWGMLRIATFNSNHDPDQYQLETLVRHVAAKWYNSLETSYKVVDQL
jgi:hypothetical protein